MTDIELIQLLANGFKVSEIAKDNNISSRTLEKRIIVLRDRVGCKTYTHLVAKYVSRNLVIVEQEINYGTNSN